jgi:hypothetical protein
MLAKLDYDVKTRGYEADLVKARNDWTGKGSKNGEAYLGRLADLGVRRTAADLNPLRGELEKILEQTISGSTGKTATAESQKLKRAAKEKITGGRAPAKGAK